MRGHTWAEEMRPFRPSMAFLWPPPSWKGTCSRNSSWALSGLGHDVLQCRGFRGDMVDIALGAESSRDSRA